MNVRCVTSSFNGKQCLAECITSGMAGRFLDKSKLCWIKRVCHGINNKAAVRIMRHSRTYLHCICLVNAQNRCRFSTTSASRGSCILPCRCTDGCNSDTGACLRGGQCQDGQPTNYKWHGPACQTGVCVEQLFINTLFSDGVMCSGTKSRHFCFNVCWL